MLAWPEAPAPALPTLDCGPARGAAAERSSAWPSHNPSSSRPEPRATDRNACESTSKVRRPRQKLSSFQKHSNPAKDLAQTSDVNLAGFALVPLPPASPHFNAIETERVGDQVLLTRARGHLTRSLVERQFEQFRRLVTTTPAPIWIMEQLELTGFDPGAVPASARWFSDFKDGGGERVIVVSTHSAARMAAASLAFAVHAKISSCESLKVAYEQAGLAPIDVRPSMYSLRPGKPGDAPPSRR